MPHLKHIGLTNFRVFGERTDIALAPLTILTGPNSSGKSSVLKAIQLLQENIADIGHLNFSHGEHKLGNFDMALNRNATDKTMVFTLPFEFQGMTEEMYMDWIYEMDTSNPLQYGKLTRLSVCLEKDGHEVIGITPWEKVDIDLAYFHRYRSLRHNIDLLEFYRYHNYSLDTFTVTYDMMPKAHDLRIASVNFLLYSKNAKGLIKQIYESNNDIEKQKLLKFLEIEFPIDFELFQLSELFINYSFGLNKETPLFPYLDFDNIQHYFGISQSFWINIPEIALQKDVMNTFKMLSSFYHCMEKEDKEHLEIIRNSLSKNEEKILSLFETQKEFLSYVNIVCNRIKENLKLKYNFTNNAELTQLLENAFFEIEKLSFTNGQSYKDFMAKAHYDINLQGFLEAIGSLSFVHNFWERIENSSNILTDFIRLIKEEDKHDLIFHTILNHITPSHVSLILRTEKKKYRNLAYASRTNR